MAKIYLVTLTDDERQQLLDLTSKGQTKARRQYCPNRRLFQRGVGTASGLL